MGLIWVVTLVGFVTASLVQWANDFLHRRRTFHHHTIAEWLNNRAKDFRSAAKDKSQASLPYVQEDVALKELESLLGAERITFGELKPLPVYSLPTEQLFGQISAAAEVVIASPTTYPALFLVFGSPERTSFNSDMTEYGDLVAAKRGKSGLDPEKEQRYGELRDQFMTQTQRVLDGLQIRTGEQWRKRLMTACGMMSFVLSFIVVVLLYRSDPTLDGPAIFEGFITVIVVALAGALAAPVAHDLMRAIRGFRRS
jgi:hypothetical protein